MTYSLKQICFKASVASILLSANALADSSLQGFFEHDSAQTPFAPDIKITEPKEIVHLRPKEDLQQAPEEEAKKAQPEQAKQEIKDRHLNQPKTRDEILARYGDPTSPYPVAAVEDAPGPFQAIYAAMNAGDDELAFKYAVQYAKFQEQLKSQNNKAVALIGHAKRKAGILPAGSWPDSPAYQEYAYLQDTEVEGLDDAATVEAEEAQEITISQETRTLISKLKETEHDLFNDRKNEIKGDLKKWEDQERSAVRKKYAGKLPVAADGIVDILVFLKNTEDESIEYGKEIQKVYNALKENKKANLATFLLGDFSPSAATGFQVRSKTTLPLLPGNQLAKEMGLKKTPAVIFVTRDGQSHIEPGLSNFASLDEIRKIMQGVK